MCPLYLDDKHLEVNNWDYLSDFMVPSNLPSHIRRKSTQQKAKGVGRKGWLLGGRQPRGRLGVLNFVAMTYCTCCQCAVAAACSSTAVGRWGHQCWWKFWCQRRTREIYEILPHTLPGQNRFLKWIQLVIWLVVWNIVYFCIRWE